MKCMSLFRALIPLFLISCGSNSTDRKMNSWLKTPGPDEVRINDIFWTPKIDRNREVTIPYVFSQCEATGRIDNFAVAGGLMDGKHTGERYNDSDVFKAH